MGGQNVHFWGENYWDSAVFGRPLHGNAKPTAPNSGARSRRVLTCAAPFVCMGALQMLFTASSASKNVADERSSRVQCVVDLTTVSRRTRCWTWVSAVSVQTGDEAGSWRNVVLPSRLAALPVAVDDADDEAERWCRTPRRLGPLCRHHHLRGNCHWRKRRRRLQLADCGQTRLIQSDSEYRVRAARPGESSAIRPPAASWWIRQRAARQSRRRRGPTATWRATSACDPVAPGRLAFAASHAIVARHRDASSCAWNSWVRSRCDCDAASTRRRASRCWCHRWGWLLSRSTSLLHRISTQPTSQSRRRSRRCRI